MIQSDKTLFFPLWSLVSFVPLSFEVILHFLVTWLKLHLHFILTESFLCYKNLASRKALGNANKTMQAIYGAGAQVKLVTSRMLSNEIEATKDT